MADCLFCRIAARELPASIIFEDQQTVAFLDTKPLFLGHVLLIPRTHIETLTDLPEDLTAPLFLAARRIAAISERPAKRATSTEDNAGCSVAG